MMFFLICVLAAGTEVWATTPRKQPPGCPFPSSPYVPPKCGPNAYFEVCSYPCPPQNCSTLWSKYKCKEECCKPECRCKDGFLRDDKTGRCIDQDECFAPCGPFERFVRCSTECQKTCANYKVTAPQSMCKPFTGCVCKAGRVRLNDDATGACVLPKECPSRRCPLHEHYAKCPSVCHPETCISMSPDFKCLLPAIPLPCKPRCICDKGYLRNHLGQCIPKNRCPVKKCPINEVWRCASTCAHDSCKRLEPGFKCPLGIVSVCIPACVCKDGYLRNDRGLCVPSKLCPASLRCGINEVAVECATVPPRQSCESVYSLYPPVDTPCRPGCNCRPGYLRNKYDICIPSEFCPTVPANQCGPNQEYRECGSACEPSCANLNGPSETCTDECVSGCFCKDGYLRDGQGYCVLRDECPLPVCIQPYEVAKDCGSYCEMRTCDDYKLTNISCPAVCVRGCFCHDGYVRNTYGVCVLPEQCPPEPICLQANEEYQSCGSSCPDTCDNYRDVNRVCTANCVPGCFCKTGYVRNLQDKTCVKPVQCPSKECTGLNEKFNPCASYCPVTCANRLTQGDWACITLCREACDCVAGTLRADNGTCVPVDQCTPPVCRENEKYMTCGTACPLTCDNYKNPPPCTKQCVEDCFCEHGRVRDRNNRCVEPKDCEPICPNGEKYNECSAHCQDTCENYNVSDRLCTYQCQSGCVCDTGTVRRKDGQCVPPSECTNATCPLDEVFDRCTAHCEPTCGNHEPHPPCTKICKPGCKCRAPLVRRKDGKCVELDQCHPICPSGEKYDECSAHCQDTCQNYNVTNRGCTYQCQSGCVCDTGTVRRKDGQCVPPSECTDPTCPVDEVFDRCTAHCEPTCENHEPHRPCSKICKPGCKCRAPLVRRKDGKCVKLDECTTQTCGPNEHYEKDRVKCDLTCQNYKLESIMGPCYPASGCFCDDGFVRDRRGVCIRKKQCPKPKTCPPNEVLSECYNTCHMTCKTRLRSDGRVCHLACIDSGCLCIDGYLRHDNGTCVPISQCSPPRCNANETFSKCGSACPETCDTRGNTCIVCTQQCVEDCFCNKGLVRADDGTCVAPQDCPPRICSDPNEKFVECPSLCPPGDECSNLWTKYDCSKFPDCCKPQCRCKSGYLRDKKGRCIPTKQCTNATCPLDEVFDRCTAHCEPTCENHEPHPPCTKICKPGCKCRAPLVRRKDGKCVKLDECNPTCPPGEKYNECSAHCQDTCKNYNVTNRGCTYQCQSGCVCDTGTVRRKDGQCVPPSECTDPTCPVDEVFDRCTAHCEPTCENHEPHPPCTKICKPGCKCRAPLVRRKDGKCVKLGKCTDPTCPVDEVFDRCTAHCEPTCENHEPHPPCTKICKPGCKCRAPLVRRKDGKCVKLGKCNTTCPPGEKYNECSAHCQDTCENYNVTNRVCTYQCQSGCVCDTGTVRRKDGQCVPPCECTPSRCNANETFSKCGSACPETCDTRGNTCIVCTEQCVEGCFCNKGLVRADDGTCMAPEDCPLRTCRDPNEEFVECPPPCPPGDYCSNMWTKYDCSIFPDCCKPQCRCKSGYLRDKKGRCIPTSQCTSSG